LVGGTDVEVGLEVPVRTGVGGLIRVEVRDGTRLAALLGDGEADAEVNGV
jgi:hypothetical protein